MSVPNKLIQIKNPEKNWDHEKWDIERMKDIANFPGPYRVMCIGKPNTGKTLVAINLILHAKPRFEEVIVIHENAQTTEYSELEPTIIVPDCPDLNWFKALVADDLNPEINKSGRIKKRCVCIDDLEMVKANTERLHNLGVLFRYISSHFNISIILCHQSFFDVSSLIRKMCNVFIIWKPHSKGETSAIERALNIPKNTLYKLFNSDIANGFYDSICIDMTPKSPAPMRLNLWNKITLDDDFAEN